MQPQDAEFGLFKGIKDYWPQILFILTLGAAGVKNHVDVKRMKTAIFDKDGSIRLQSKADCEKYQDGCSKQRDAHNQDRIRELQNIHAAINDLRGIITNHLGDKGS